MVYGHIPIKITLFSLIEGGLIMWNITEGYETIGKDYEHYDAIVQRLIDEGKWVHHCPVKE